MIPLLLSLVQLCTGHEVHPERCRPPAPSPSLRARDAPWVAGTSALFVAWGVQARAGVRNGRAWPGPNSVRRFLPVCVTV